MMHPSIALIGALSVGHGLAQSTNLPFSLKLDRLVKSEVRSLDSEPPLKGEWTTLPIDHWNASVGKYQNRYWVQEKFYKPGGPILIFDGGEGEAESSTVWLEASNSFFFQMLKQFNGMGVLWEHRYYGKSLPPQVNFDQPRAVDFQYLNTEQALADVHDFVWNFTRSSYSDLDLTPAKTPWVFVGGSYPGMRAAFMRSLYPDTIYASYAASAPVQASVDMSFYFEPIWQGLVANGYQNCTADIHAATLKMDEILEDPVQGKELKERFIKNGSASNEYFADSMTALYGGWQGRGLPSLSGFCDWISTDPASNTTSDSNGWAATSKGVGFTIDRWATWPCLDVVTGVRKNVDRNDSCYPLYYPNDDPNANIAWLWQTCIQWGFFQSANLGEHQMVSKYNSLEHQRDFCHQTFPDGLSTGILQLWPPVDKVNKDLGGWDIRPSQTFWSAGEFDPWRTLSPLSDMPFSPNNKAIQMIPECSTENGEEDGGPVFGYLMSNAEHCWDFSLSHPQAKDVLELFREALTKWLGCFRPSVSSRITGSKAAAKLKMRRVYRY